MDTGADIPVDAAQAGTAKATAPPLPSPERLRELLFDAARTGRDDMIPALLQAGVTIEAVGERGHTALILASYNGHESTTALVLDHGALPDGLPEALGNSALMGVAFKGYEGIARLLIDAGADANRTNRAGQTPLMMAALFDRRSIIELLLAHGADAGHRDGSGATAADLASAQGNEDLATMLRALPRR